MGTSIPITVEGKEYESLAAAAEAYGQKAVTVSYRLAHGWTVEEAFKTPPTIPSAGRTTEMRNCNGNGADTTEHTDDAQPDIPGVRTEGRFKFITFQGETLSMSAMAKKHGMSQATLSSRLFRDGLSVEEALTIPVGVSRYEYFRDKKIYDAKDDYNKFSGSLSSISKEQYDKLIDIFKDNVLSDKELTVKAVLGIIDKNKIVNPDKPGAMPSKVIELFKRFSLDGRFSVGCYILVKQWYEACAAEEGHKKGAKEKCKEVIDRIKKSIDVVKKSVEPEPDTENDEETEVEIETVEAIEKSVGKDKETEERAVIFEEEEMDEESLDAQEKARKYIAETLGSGPFSVHAAFRKELVDDCKAKFWDRIAWRKPREKGYLIERKFQTEEERYAYIQGLEDAKLSRYSCLLDEDIFNLISVYEDIDEAMYDLMLACREAEGEQKKKLHEALLKLKRIRDRRR